MVHAPWYLFDEGKSIGKQGSENGIVLRDEEHSDGARITLERGGRHPFAITCGIYGWMVHTRFFTNQPEAELAFDQMKIGLGDILNLIPYSDEPQAEEKEPIVGKAIGQFIEQFP